MQNPTKIRLEGSARSYNTGVCYMYVEAIENVKKCVYVCMCVCVCVCVLETGQVNM